MFSEAPSCGLRTAQRLSTAPTQEQPHRRALEEPGPQQTQEGTLRQTLNSLRTRPTLFHDFLTPWSIILELTLRQCSAYAAACVAYVPRDGQEGTEQAWVCPREATRAHLTLLCS